MHHHYLFPACNLICNFPVVELCLLGTFIYWFWVFFFPLLLYSGAKVKGSWQLNRSLSTGRWCLTLLERVTVPRGSHGAAGAHAGVLR